MNLSAVWQSLIVCDGPHCTYSDLITLVQHFISDLVILATLLATVAFIWTGFMLVTSGGNPGAMGNAKKTLASILIGFFWILAAWIVVYTITSLLLKDGYSILGAPR